MLLLGNESHLASLQMPSSSQSHGSSSSSILTYTGLDGKIGVDKVDFSSLPERNGIQNSQNSQSSSHSVPARDKDRELHAQTTLSKTQSRASHQRNVQTSVSTEPNDKSDKEVEQFPAKRARTTSAAASISKETAVDNNAQK